jgi:hypothetical protein
MRQIRRSDGRVGSVDQQRPQRQVAVQAGIGLSELVNVLANATSAKKQALILQNANAYTNSQGLIIGVGAAAMLLALVLGFVLSCSLIGPGVCEASPERPRPHAREGGRW